MVKALWNIIGRGRRFFVEVLVEVVVKSDLYSGRSMCSMGTEDGGEVN